MTEFGFDSDLGNFSMELSDYKVKRVKKFDRLWKVGTGGSITSSPFLYKGLVYFGCADHFIYAINPENGKLVWKFRTEGIILEGSVYIQDGIVYVGSFDKNFYALRADNGQLIWKFKTGDMIACTPTIDEGIIYFGGKDHNVYALKVETGELVWKFRTFDSVISQPLIIGNKLVLGSYDHNLYCLDKKTGYLFWKLVTQGEIHNANELSHKDGIVYFSCFDNQLRAVNLETGKELWKIRLGQYGCCTAPVLYKDVLYATTRNGILFAVSLKGRILWKKIFRDNTGIPCIYDEKIYVGSCDYNMHCLTLDGKELWKFKTNGYVWWKSVRVGNKLIFGSWDCLLYCVDINTHEAIWKFRTAGGPSYIPPANEAFEVEIHIPETVEQVERKTYQLNIVEESQEEGSFYKSTITYQGSTRYQEKGKYQIDSDEEAF